MEANDHVDAAHRRAIGCRRQLGDDDVIGGDVRQGAGLFMEEVVVIVDVRIKVRSGSIDDDFAQEPRRGELMQGVVNRRQGYAYVRRRCLIMEDLRGDMPVAVFEQQLGQRQTLPRWTQTARAKAFEDMTIRPSAHDIPYGDRFASRQYPFDHNMAKP